MLLFRISATSAKFVILHLKGITFGMWSLFLHHLAYIGHCNGVVSKHAIGLYGELWKTIFVASLSVFASFCFDFGWLLFNQLIRPFWSNVVFTFLFVVCSRCALFCQCDSFICFAHFVIRIDSFETTLFEKSMEYLKIRWGKWKPLQYLPILCSRLHAETWMNSYARNFVNGLKVWTVNTPRLQYLQIDNHE